MLSMGGKVGPTALVILYFRVIDALKDSKDYQRHRAPKQRKPQPRLKLP